MEFKDLSQEQKEKLLELMIWEIPGYLEHVYPRNMFTTTSFALYLIKPFAHKKDDNEFVHTLYSVFGLKDQKYSLFDDCFSYFGINFNDLCEVLKNEIR